MLERAAQRLIFTAWRHEPPRDTRRVPVVGPAGFSAGEDAYHVAEYQSAHHS